MPSFAVVLNKSTVKNTLGFIVLFLLTLFSIALMQMHFSRKPDVSSPKHTLIKTETPTGDRLFFVDENGDGCAVLHGYSTIERELGENGKPVRQFYSFAGKPVAMPYGEYGDQYVYDAKGRISERTFLDQNGEPMVGNNGVTVTKSTYYDNNVLKTERYYDLKGNAVKSTAGCYGKRYIGKIVLSLNKSGHVRFDISELLNQLPGLVIVFALIIIFVLCFTKRNVQIITLGIFLAFVLFQTLFRQAESNIAGMYPLWSYRQFFTNDGLRTQILNNIWLFVPLGTAVYTLSRKPKFLFIPVVFSAMIEIIQFLSHRGLCEFDDILSNTIGACIGFVFGLELCKIKNRIKTALKNASYENLRKAAFRDKN